MDFDCFNIPISNTLLMTSDASYNVHDDHISPSIGIEDSSNNNDLFTSYVNNFRIKSTNHLCVTAIQSPPDPPASLSLDHYFFNRTSMVHGVESFRAFRSHGNGHDQLSYVPNDKSIGRSYSQGSSVMGGRCVLNTRRNNNGTIHKKVNVIKGQWTLEEDKLLVKLVEQYGLRKWSHIAQMLNGRIGKQCRERWHNHLRPNIKKDTWSEEEDRILIQAHSEIGNKWAEIAKRLSGRTENSIKNHWNATKRRQFARRRCRSSKHPKSGAGSLLQDYIKSLSLLNPSPAPAAANTNESVASTAEAAPPFPMPSWDDDFSDVAEELMMLDKKEMELMTDICDVGFLLDHLGCGGGSSSYLKDQLEECLSMSSDEKVKKEMDLVEMISDHHNHNGSSNYSCACHEMLAA